MIVIHQPMIRILKVADLNLDSTWAVTGRGGVRGSKTCWCNTWMLPNQQYRVMLWWWTIWIHSLYICTVTFSSEGLSKMRNKIWPNICLVTTVRYFLKQPQKKPMTFSYYPALFQQCFQPLRFTAASLSALETSNLIKQSNIKTFYNAGKFP